MAKFMGNSSRVLSLPDGRYAPLHLSCLPRGPGHIAGWHPPWHGRIGIPPFRSYIFLCIELHLAEFLPDTCFIIPCINAKDSVIVTLKVSLGGFPEGVNIAFHAVTGPGSVRSRLILPVFIETVGPVRAWHPVRTKRLEHSDTEFAARLFHPIAV